MTPTDIALAVIVVVVFYGLSLAATKSLFAAGGGINRNKLLLIAPLPPIAFWGSAGNQAALNEGDVNA
jgi:hypothetical protein